MRAGKLALGVGINIVVAQDGFHGCKQNFNIQSNGLVLRIPGVLEALFADREIVAVVSLRVAGDAGSNQHFRQLILLIGGQRVGA